MALGRPGTVAIDCSLELKDTAMTTPFLACAAITVISSVVSLGFSLAAIRGVIGDARTLALYATVRSVALLLISIVAAFIHPQWLVAAAMAMIIVQAGDAWVGTTIRDAMKTYGPAATASANLLALVWLLLQ
jgi:acyl-coenzyme A synthetase/AMP-(fatty) acid ligase